MRVWPPSSAKILKQKSLPAGILRRFKTVENRSNSVTLGNLRYSNNQIGETMVIAGLQLRQALRKIGKWAVEIIKRSDHVKGFEVLPKSRVVDQTFSWLGRNSRLAKDCGQTLASATAWLFIASIQLFARRITRA